MNDTVEVDVYWTVQNARRWSVSLSQQEAWESLKELHAYSENPQGWTVEHSREHVPIATGEVVVGEGEIVELDDDGGVASRRSFALIHVFWACPLCGRQHNTGLNDSQVMPSNPKIWFCDFGKGIVLVGW